MNNCDIQDGSSGLDFDELLEEDNSDTQIGSRKIHKEEMRCNDYKDQDETEVESLTDVKDNAAGTVTSDRGLNKIDFTLSCT